MRTAQVNRHTKETQVTIELNLDGSGQRSCTTGSGFFDHMLDQLACHSSLDLRVQAQGDLHVDAHHTVEDVGITFGQALSRALGDKKGIARFGHAYVPLDESLVRSVIDLSGRPGLFFHVPFTRSRIGEFDVDLVREFFQGCANHIAATIHIDCIRGENSHHQAEAVFKSFARALCMAVRVQTGALPSTKGLL